MFFLAFFLLPAPEAPEEASEEDTAAGADGGGVGLEEEMAAAFLSCFFCSFFFFNRSCSFLFLTFFFLTGALEGPKMSANRMINTTVKASKVKTRILGSAFSRSMTLDGFRKSLIVEWCCEGVVYGVVKGLEGGEGRQTRGTFFVCEVKEPAFRGTVDVVMGEDTRLFP